jgi:prevent-host-death family protein
MCHYVAMTRVGVRELRDNISAVLRRVASGEAIEITDHGHPVARLVPLSHKSVLDQMIAEGRATPASRSIGDLPEPIKLAPGSESVSDVLRRMREEERW